MEQSKLEKGETRLWQHTIMTNVHHLTIYELICRKQAPVQDEGGEAEGGGSGFLEAGPPCMPPVPANLTSATHQGCFCNAQPLIMLPQACLKSTDLSQPRTNGNSFSNLEPGQNEASKRRSSHILTEHTIRYSATKNAVM